MQKANQEEFMGLLCPKVPWCQGKTLCCRDPVVEAKQQVKDISLDESVAFENWDEKACNQLQTAEKASTQPSNTE